MKDRILDFANNSSYAVFMFILALFSAWSWQLLPSKVIDLFETDRRAQLVVLFLLVLFTVDLFKPEVAFHMNLINALAIFVLYLVISKQSLNFFLITVAMLVVNTVLTNYVQHYDNLVTDGSASENDKKVLGKLKMALKASLLATGAVIVFGSLTYFKTQYSEHRGKSSSLLQFLGRFVFAGSEKQQEQTGLVV
tara:strand:- start:74 stop:655 length:582 start_codon:yes stop_codon:yes gene_type:complete